MYTSQRFPPHEQYVMLILGVCFLRHSVYTFRELKTCQYNCLRVWASRYWNNVPNKSKTL